MPPAERKRIGKGQQSRTAGLTSAPGEGIVACPVPNTRAGQPRPLPEKKEKMDAPNMDIVACACLNLQGRTSAWIVMLNMMFTMAVARMAPSFHVPSMFNDMDRRFVQSPWLRTTPTQ